MDPTIAERQRQWWLRTVYVIHKVLAGHKRGEVCSECEVVGCHHCGTFGTPGEDHTCPCPNSDETCTEHPDPRRPEAGDPRG